MSKVVFAQETMKRGQKKARFRSLWLRFVVRRCPDPPLGRYDFGFFWNFNTGKQILPCVIETQRFSTPYWVPGGPLTPPKVSQKQPNPLVTITEEWKISLLIFFDNFIFWCLLVIFHQYPTLAGGLNTIHRAPYWAKSLSYDNRRKNPSTVWWFSRIFENHRALMMMMIICKWEQYTNILWWWWRWWWQ